MPVSHTTPAGANPIPVNARDAFDAAIHALGVNNSCDAYTILNHAAAQVRCELDQLSHFCDIGTPYEGIGHILAGAVRRLEAASDLAEHVHEAESAPSAQVAEDEPADALRQAIDLCNDEIGDDIATALSKLEDARRKAPDVDPQALLDVAIVAAHNSVTAAFGKLGRGLRGGDR